MSRENVELLRRVIDAYNADLIVYVKAYAHREDALSDLGISEDALERIEP